MKMKELENIWKKYEKEVPDVRWGHKESGIERILSSFET